MRNSWYIADFIMHDCWTAHFRWLSRVLSFLILTTLISLLSPAVLFWRCSSHLALTPTQSLLMTYRSFQPNFMFSLNFFLGHELFKRLYFSNLSCWLWFELYSQVMGWSFQKLLLFFLFENNLLFNRFGHSLRNFSLFLQRRQKLVLIPNLFYHRASQWLLVGLERYCLCLAGFFHLKLLWFALRNTIISA